MNDLYWRQINRELMKKVKNVSVEYNKFFDGFYIKYKGINIEFAKTNYMVYKTLSHIYDIEKANNQNE